MQHRLAVKRYRSEGECSDKRYRYQNTDDQGASDTSDQILRKTGIHTYVPFSDTRTHRTGVA